MRCTIDVTIKISYSTVIRSSKRIWNRIRLLRAIEMFTLDMTHIRKIWKNSTRIRIYKTTIRHEVFVQSNKTETLTTLFRLLDSRLDLFWSIKNNTRLRTREELYFVFAMLIVSHLTQQIKIGSRLRIIRTNTISSSCWRDNFRSNVAHTDSSLALFRTTTLNPIFPSTNSIQIGVIFFIHC